MNTTNNIAAMQAIGVTNAPQSPAKSPDSQGLFGVLNAVIQQAQTAPENKSPAPAAQNSPANIKVLTEKIAALLQKQDDLPDLKEITPDQLATIVAAMLQKNGALPAALQNLTPDDLAAKILALLQKNEATPVVQPTLTSDLIAPMSSEIQEAVAKEPSNEELAALLNQIQPAADSTSDIARILAELKAQSTSDAPDTNILLQLKDKIAELQLTTGEINKDALVEFKTDIMALLKDQGMSRPEIQHYMQALAKFLRQDAAPAVELAAAPVQPLPLPDVTAEEAPTAAQNTTPADDMVADLKSKIIVPPEMPEQAAPAAGKKEAEAAIRPQLPSTAAAQAQQQASTTPQQNVTAKVSGLGVNPAMISALAQGDGNFGADGFGSQSNAQQALMNGAGMLKPVSVDALNNQHFTNYLSGTHSPSSVTQMVNIQLQRNIQAKIDTMTLQLEPADLGRLDIKLKFEKDGSIRAHMIVEKPETLALLQKDSHHLERALQQAGIDADENSLSFDLRQQSQHNLEGFDGRNGRGSDEFATHMSDTAAEKVLQAKIAIQSHGYITASGVNIMV